MAGRAVRSPTNAQASCVVRRKSARALTRAPSRLSLARRDATPDSFYRACSSLSESEAATEVSTFVSLMLMALDYEPFADIMRSREKRRYYFSILGAWRQTLCAQPPKK